MTLESLRREHAQSHIGSELAGLLERIVRSTSASYPGEYSDSGAWNDESRADALQDWIEVRLLGRGDLSAMLVTAASEGALRAALTTSFRQFLINRRGRTSASNLFKRAQLTLETSERFRLAGGRGRSSSAMWTLAADVEGAASNLSLESLLSLAWDLSDGDLGVVRYGPNSLKSSPILRQAGLEQFLGHLLAGARGAVSMTQIAAVMRLRFNLAHLDTAELSASLTSPDASPSAQIERAELASSVLARVGQHAVRCLGAFATADGDLERAAGSLGVSRKEIKTQIALIVALIADDADDAEEAMGVYTILVESLFKE